jgi:hypothetical protein
VVFNRKHANDEQQTDHSGLVELLLGADEVERKRILLLALQTGELRKSEAADLLRLVDRLEAVAGARKEEEQPEPQPEPQDPQNSQDYEEPKDLFIR